MENVNYFNSEYQRLSEYYDYIEDWYIKSFKNNRKEKKFYSFKYKLTPHYFDLKCRCNSLGELINGSIQLNEKNKREIILNLKKLNVLYRPRLYYVFKSWYQYWRKAFSLEKTKNIRSKYSIARTRQTLFDLCSCNFIKGHSLFLTLTYDINKKLSSTIYDVAGAFDYDKALIDIKRFVQRFKRTFGEKMQFCYFIEQQNGKHNDYNWFTGAYHFHILIFNAMYFKMGLKYKDCKENAQKLWGHGIAFVEKIPQRNINNTCKYISKYISKDTLCVESGNHALHSSKGLNRPKERLYSDLPSYLDNCISLELCDNLAMFPNGFKVEDILPLNNDFMPLFSKKPIVIHSRYIDITIMRLPYFNDDGDAFIDEKCDILIKVHCDLDYRKNFFKKVMQNA